MTMNQRPQERAQPVSPHAASARPSRGDAASARNKKGSRRESIESFVVVFLAFLIWSLEAEGFVIPTGSMAPTLMGRHKEITCQECGYVYTVNADREVEAVPPGEGAGPRIQWGTCENCRFEAAVGEAPSFSGDRIYVMKDGVSLPFFPQVGRVQLKRWDVAVFKLPEKPEVRYIKRLVGMPGEVLRIQEGDVWVGPQTQGVPVDFERALRPLEHQQAMQVMVYDDRYRAASLRGDPAWRRWSTAVPRTWIEPHPGAYAPDRASPEWSELRYRHLVPAPDQWQAIRAGRRPEGPARATLITDFSSYNTDLAAADRGDPRRASRSWLQPHWVGDLTLSLRLAVRQPAGSLRLELIRGGRPHRCEIDLASGEARLSRDGAEPGPAAPTPIARPGTYDLTFAHVDGRLTLWVDRDLPFGQGWSYPADPEPAGPTEADLEPARIAAKGAEVSVEDLVLKRDVYYTLDPSEPDYANLGEAAHYEPSALFDLLADPARLAALTHRPPRDFPIAPGRYLMLGDNSPWSSDGRAWGDTDRIDPDRPNEGWDDSGRESWEVPEALIIGKAFCVYWPHLQPVWPNLRLSADMRFPALPYIQRIRWIR
jgi:signal peptidase I